MIPPVGTFGLVHTNGRAATAIRLATLARVNHAFLVVDDRTIIEANPDGVDTRPLDEYDHVAWSHRAIPLSAWQGTQVAGFARTRLGDAYNWPGIAALGFDHFLGWRPAWLDDRANQPTTWFCSQLVVAAYRFAGIDLTPGKPDWTVSPGDLSEVLLYR